MIEPIIYGIIVCFAYYLAGVLSKLYKEDYSHERFKKGLYFYLMILFIYIVFTFILFISNINGVIEMGNKYKDIQTLKQFLEIILSDKLLFAWICVVLIYGITVCLFSISSLMNLLFLVPRFFLLGTKYEQPDKQSLYYALYLLGFFVINSIIMLIILQFVSSKNQVNFNEYQMGIFLGLGMLFIGYFLEKKRLVLKK